MRRIMRCGGTLQQKKSAYIQGFQRSTTTARTAVLLNNKITYIQVRPKSVTWFWWIWWTDRRRSALEPHMSRFRPRFWFRFRRRHSSKNENGKRRLMFGNQQQQHPLWPFFAAFAATAIYSSSSSSSWEADALSMWQPPPCLGKIMRKEERRFHVCVCDVATAALSSLRRNGAFKYISWDDLCRLDKGGITSYGTYSYGGTALARREGADWRTEHMHAIMMSDMTIYLANSLNRYHIRY